MWVYPKGQGHRSMPINADQQIRYMVSLIDWTKFHFSENITDRVKELQIEVFFYMPTLDMGRQDHRSKPINADRQI